MVDFKGIIWLMCFLGALFGAGGGPGAFLMNLAMKVTGINVYGIIASAGFSNIPFVGGLINKAIFAAIVATLSVEIIWNIWKWLQTGIGAIFHTGAFVRTLSFEKLLVWGLGIGIVGAVRLVDLKFRSFGGFFSAEPGWARGELIVGIILVILGGIATIIKKRRAAGAESFPMLGWAKGKGVKHAARRVGIEKSLYMTIGDLTPLVEHEYRAVVMKIYELENAGKGKRVPMDTLIRLRQSKRDIENKIVGKVIQEGGIQDPYLNEIAMEMSKTVKDADVINERLTREVLHHIKRTTLPQAKKFEKKKDTEIRRGTEDEKPQRRK
jgi:hypothetical protein